MHDRPHTVVPREFAKEAFDSAGVYSDEARRLADKLARYVQEIVDGVVVAAVAEVVKQLNSMGHDLEQDYPPEQGDVLYSDTSSGRVLLRLACDSVISTGYAHMSSAGDVDVS